MNRPNNASYLGFERRANNMIAHLSSISLSDAAIPAMQRIVDRLDKSILRHRNNPTPFAQVDDLRNRLCVAWSSAIGVK